MQEPRTALWSGDGHFGGVFCCTRSELRAPGNTYINMTSGFPAGSIKNVERVCWVSHEEGFHIQVLVPFWLEAQLTRDGADKSTRVALEIISTV